MEIVKVKYGLDQSEQLQCALVNEGNAEKTGLRFLDALHASASICLFLSIQNQ